MLLLRSRCRSSRGSEDRAMQQAQVRSATPTYPTNLRCTSPKCLDVEGLFRVSMPPANRTASRDQVSAIGNARWDRPEVVRCAFQHLDALAVC
jgi:hypothetical protein